MKRILIVDDESLIADTITLIFRDQGFDVCTAYSAAEALLCARKFKPELIVCDITMPGRSGLELMRDLYAELPDCKIIFLSAQYTHQAAVCEQSRQMQRQISFLTKPCHPLDLLHEAGAVLAGA